jgi:hypothetical protein
MLGDQGKPIDYELLPEDVLQKKELDQGTAYFQLQHMLNTAMMDAMKYPLKPERLVVIQAAGNRYPLTVVRGMTQDKLKDYAVHEFGFRMSQPHDISRETSELQSVWAYVDPAGGGANGDETAYAIGGFLNGNIYLLAVGGIAGGYEENKLDLLAKRLARYKPNGVTIEKNMGFGAFRAVFQPILRRELPSCQVVDDLVHGQKEARIISTIEPIMGRGALIIDEGAVREDLETTQQHPPAARLTYSFFYQLAKMSMVRNALIHDDRVDAVEGLCRHFSAAVALDQRKLLEQMTAKAHAEAIYDPLGYKRYSASAPKGPSMLRNRR